MFSYKNIAKVIWLFLCLVVLVKYLVSPEAWSNYELSMLLGIEMLVLSFPLGALVWVWIWLFELVAPNFEISTIISVPIYWVAMVAIGYIQWFKLLPFLYIKFKNRNAG